LESKHALVEVGIETDEVQIVSVLVISLLFKNCQT